MSVYTLGKIPTRYIAVCVLFALIFSLALAMSNVTSYLAQSTHSPSAFWEYAPHALAPALVGLAVVCVSYILTRKKQGAIIAIHSFAIYYCIYTILMLLEMYQWSFISGYIYLTLLALTSGAIAFTYTLFTRKNQNAPYHTPQTTGYVIAGVLLATLAIAITKRLVNISQYESLNSVLFTISTTVALASVGCMILVGTNWILKHVFKQSAHILTITGLVVASIILHPVFMLSYAIIGRSAYVIGAPLILAGAVVAVYVSFVRNK